MKKYAVLVFSAMLFFLTSCTIDYTSYYEKYGDIINKDDTLNSAKIPEDTLSYPSNNDELIYEYDLVYSSERPYYRPYASYYSSKYDTLYISYDSVFNPVQTIDSRDLALMEEHLLNYFSSDTVKTDYTQYLKVVRIYSDYKSSICRSRNDTVDIYSKIEGCAQYNGKEASININGLVDIADFFNPISYVENGYQYIKEPKRDTFAHEFGHVSTYYNMILKGDNSYYDYLQLRLEGVYDRVYPEGLPKDYEIDYDYYTQPVEILADDYVELYYDVSNKKSNDYNEYQLSYTDLRNSLKGINGVTQYLKDNPALYQTMKDYYDVFINKKYTEYQTKKVVVASGNVFNSLHDIANNIPLNSLYKKEIVVLGEVIINSKVYYRVVLSNIVKENEFNIRSEFSFNVGYILSSDCSMSEKEVLYFTKSNGEEMHPNTVFEIKENINVLPYYDFSYFIKEGKIAYIYNHLDEQFEILKADIELFS